MLQQGLILLLFLVAISCPHSIAQTLYFSAIPHHNRVQEELLYSMVAKHLTERLNMPVEFIASSDYHETLSLFGQRKIAFAWFGGLTGLLAKNSDPNAQAIVMGFEDQFFKTLLIANYSSGLSYSNELPSKLRGKTLALGSELSTSGRLFPEYFLQQRFGEPIANVFTKIGYSGRHEKTIHWVEQGLYDVGAVNFQVWYALLQKGRINTARVGVIWESPPYSDYHVLACSDLDKRFGEGFQRKLESAMLSMNANGQLMKIFGRSHFVKASKRDFTDVERAAKQLGLIDEHGRYVPAKPGSDEQHQRRFADPEVSATYQPSD